MRKNIYLAVFAVFFLALTLGLASAADSYSSYWNGNSYSGGSFGINYPSYTYTPTVNSQASDMIQQSSYSNANYNGPLIEKVFTYDSSLDVINRDRFKQTLSVKMNEYYSGGSSYSNSGSNSNEQHTNNYNSYSPNPNSYNGGSYWGKAPDYDSSNYRSSSYSNPYYYSPRYDSSSGYYNWRY